MHQKDCFRLSQSHLKRLDGCIQMHFHYLLIQLMICCQLYLVSCSIQMNHLDVNILSVTKQIFFYQNSGHTYRNLAFLMNTPNVAVLISCRSKGFKLQLHVTPPMLKMNPEEEAHWHCLYTIPIPTFRRMCILHAEANLEEKEKALRLFNFKCTFKGVLNPNFRPFSFELNKK